MYLKHYMILHYTHEIPSHIFLPYFRKFLVCRADSKVWLLIDWRQISNQMETYLLRLSDHLDCIHFIFCLNNQRYLQLRLLIIYVGRNRMLGRNYSQANAFKFKSRLLFFNVYQKSKITVSFL